jgi:intron-binding protein aquarius
MDRFNKKEAGDVYETFNILVRRRPEENNFKAVLETIRDLMQSDLVVPEWLQRVFLGYGDASSAHYTNMPNRVRQINFRDTYLNWEHLKASFPGKVHLLTQISFSLLANILNPNPLSSLENRGCQW